MKVLPLLLAASLLANATLLTVTLRKNPALPANASESSAAKDLDSKKSASTGANALLPPELVAALNGDDTEALRDLLRSAGLSEEMVRSFVQMSIWKKYEARFKALNHQQSPDTSKPWWKDDRNQLNRWNGGMSKAQRDESRRLQQEIRDETTRLLGANGNPNKWVDPRMDFLAADKQEAFRKIQQDYQELMNEIQQDSQGFQLPSDAEKYRFLQSEQKRDLEALMTPQELQAYDLRMSSTANQLRWKMTQLDATEQEYLAIYPLQKAFDDRYNPQASNPYGYSEQPDRDQSYWTARRDAEKKLQDQIRSLVGEERYAESIRRQDPDWQQLEGATRRLALPADTPGRLFALRDTAASTVQQIAANPNLTADQKKQGLAALATQTRDQVRAALGEEGAKAYFINNGMTWLKELENGNTITFSKDATGYNTKALPKDP